ncbi:MAG: MBL fold metallo-hydrolase [Pseudomonadota bacterium]
MAFFRQLLDAPGGAFSYLLGCGESRTALMLDPALEQATLVLGMLEELGLDLLWVVETHLHADHVTAADALRAATGARVAVGRLTGIDGADRLLDDGDVIACGGVSLRALATPGHTPGCLSYLWQDRVFTGDCLLIGACGVTNESGGDAATLYDSVTRRLFALPGETLVYPGRCLAGRRVSCIGEERETNPLFRGMSRDRFATLEAREEEPAGAARTADVLAINRRCGQPAATDASNFSTPR